MVLHRNLVPHELNNKFYTSVRIVAAVAMFCGGHKCYLCAFYKNEGRCAQPGTTPYR
jgi:hypothetical protein